MKLTLKRDLPLLLAALLVIWGLWYTRRRFLCILRSR